MAELEIEKIAQDRYRLRAHGQIITLSAQDLLDTMDWCLLHAKELEKEPKEPDATAYNREMGERNRIAAENREKPWLPGYDE
jgi:hypothetical protein